MDPTVTSTPTAETPPALSNGRCVAGLGWPEAGGRSLEQLSSPAELEAG